MFKLKKSKKDGLDKSELFQALDGSVAAIRVIDKKFNIIYQNKKMDELSGVNSEKAIGMRCSDELKGHTCKSKNCTLVKLLKGEEVIEGEVEKETSKGEKIPVKLRATPLKDTKGDVVGVIESFADISDIKEQQKKLEDQKKIDESFLQGMPDPAFKTDKNLVITDVNKAFAEAMGYSIDEVVGKMTCGDLCKTPVCNTDSCTIKNCIKTKGTIVAETHATTRDGKKLPIRAACGVLLDKNNEPVGGFELLTDLSALHSMVENVEKVSKGDLTVEVEEEYKNRDDSTGTLAKAIDTMVESMANLVENVKQGVSTLSSSAQELSSSAQEVNASVEETSSSVQQIADGASNTTNQSNIVLAEIKKAGETAGEGKDAADKLLNKMQIIKQTTEDGANKISSLGEKSTAIGDIINVINSISEQTNLLALNAAIEAARAGDAGRGFAVVADEVRKLAEESQNATKQIGSLITDIQNEITGAVKSMDKNREQVNEGHTDVENAVNAFKKIPIIVQSVDKAASEVSAVAEENAASSEETSSATQQVTASMQQVTGAATKLTELSTDLQSQVEKFKTNNSFEKLNDLSFDSNDEDNSKKEDFKDSKNSKKEIKIQE